MQHPPHTGFLSDKHFRIIYVKVDNKWFCTTLKQGTTYLTQLMHWFGEHKNSASLHYRSWQKTPQEVYDQGATIVVRHPRNRIWSGLVQDLFLERGTHNQELQDFVRRKPNNTFNLHDEYYDEDLYDLGIYKDRINYVFFDKHHDQMVMELVGLFNNNFSRIWNNSIHSTLFYYAFDEYRNYEPIRNIPFNWLPINELDYTNSLKHLHKFNPGHNVLTHSNRIYYPLLEDVMVHPFLYPRVRDKINKILDKEVWYYEKLKRVIPRFSKKDI